MKYGDDPVPPVPRKPRDVGVSLGDGSGLADPGIVHRTMAQARAWSGPLPPPDILGEYERQLPGAAERILSFAMRLTTAMITISAIFFGLAVARVGNTSAAMIGGSVFLSVPVIMLFRAFITRH
jgi:hypothetical protein